MARMSRHKSHRSHKHRDRSDSEDEGNSRDSKPTVEEEEVRISRVSDQEKKKSSSKDKGDASGDHGKGRKDDDRWNGGGRDYNSRVEKESKKEGFDVLDLEKSSKSKSGSSRRQDESSERNEEKRRSEKESGRRESSSQYKDGKEKEKDREREKGSEKEKDREREKGSEKDKKVQDSKHDRSDDRATTKQGVEISELQDDMRKPEVEKELDRRNRRRVGYSDHDRVDDRKESDDRQASYRDDYSRNGNYKDGRYKEKYREDHDRDQRHREEKRKDERSSRTHTSDRSESKHYKDENKMLETRDKKTKLQDSDRDGSHHGDDNNTKCKDARGRKRSTDEMEDHNDMKPRIAKESREETTKTNSSSRKHDSRADRVRLEHSHIDKGDSSLSNTRTKNSPNNRVNAVKDQSRHSSRQPESARRESLSIDARRSGAISRDYRTSSGSRDRVPESRSSKRAEVKDNIHSDVLMSESHHDRIPISDLHTSPNQLTKKSPSANERRSERSTARRSLDAEEGGRRSSNSRGGRERENLAEKPDENDISQEIPKRDRVPPGPSYNRSAQLQGNSPGRLLPPPPNRFGSNNPSILGFYEDENRIQNGDPKTNARYRRGGRDASVGRGPGTPWKNSTPTWSSPVANGFMPLQHGPPPSFHPVVPQFPAPNLFSGRPPMDLNNSSYQIHEAGNRFAGHVPRPYGWHNSVDDHPPHLQMWDGNPNVFVNEWDQNRLLMSSRGWEMSTDNIWRGQNGNVGMEKEHEYSRQARVDEAWVGQSENHSRNERARSDQLIADGGGVKAPSDSSPAKQSVGAPKSLSEKAPELSKIPTVEGISETRSDENARYCSFYLSKLDISPDLAHPDVYEQCMSLLESGNRHAATHNVSTLGRRKNHVERLVSKSRQYSSIFPTASDATYQRAMALYRKQKEGMKVMTPCSQNNRPDSKEGEEVANALAGDCMEEDENVAAIVDGDAEEMWCDNKPAGGEGEGCDDNKLPNAIVSVEGSEEGDAKLLPECRENISRIHLSPESTH